MVNYQNGKIYKLWCPYDSRIYVGSTTNELHKRLYQHKKDAARKNISSCILFENNPDSVKIELIEFWPCNTRKELEKREGFHVRRLDCVNKNIPGQTKKENNKKYREQNKDKIREIKERWREQNKDKIKEYSEQYYKQNKDKCKENYKRWREQNKDKIKEYSEQYYKQNKDKRKEYNKKYREKKKKQIKEDPLLRIPRAFEEAFK